MASGEERGLLPTIKIKTLGLVTRPLGTRNCNVVTREGKEGWGTGFSEFRRYRPTALRGCEIAQASHLACGIAPWLLAAQPFSQQIEPVLVFTVCPGMHPATPGCPGSAHGICHAIYFKFNLSRPECLLGLGRWEVRDRRLRPRLRPLPQASGNGSARSHACDRHLHRPSTGSCVGRT